MRSSELPISRPITKPTSLVRPYLTARIGLVDAAGLGHSVIDRRVFEPAFGNACGWSGHPRVYRSVRAGMTILIEQQPHAEASRRSRVAANSNAALTCSGVSSGKSATISSVVMPDAK